MTRSGSLWLYGTILSWLLLLLLILVLRGRYTDCRIALHFSPGESFRSDDEIDQNCEHRMRWLPFPL